MALSTEHKEIPEGADWTEITNTQRAFDIQNTVGVLMEYSFTDGVSKGSYLTPYTVIYGIKQSIFVRFHNVEQKGTISITRDT